jgi:hypothetical protein
MGLPGADNRIAFELRRDGASGARARVCVRALVCLTVHFIVKNPCARVVSMHVHASNVRNYDDASPKVRGVKPPP